MMCMMALSVSAWWDTDWNNRYPVNVTETVGLARVNEPFKVDVSGIGCYFGNKSDLRVVLDDTTEIPSQLISSGDEVVFVANVSANFDGTLAYIYCNNSAASPPSYTTGFSVTSDSLEVQHIIVGDIDNIKLDFKWGKLVNWSSNQGFNASDAAAGFGNWRNAGGIRWYESGECTLSDSGSVYSKLNCTDGAAQTELEFYMLNGLYKYTPTKADYLYGMFNQIGGGATISWADNLFDVYHNDTYMAENYTTGDGVRVGFNTFGKLGFYASDQPYGLFLFYNYTNMEDANSSELNRNGAGTELSCYFVYFNSTYPYYDCNSDNAGNMTTLGSTSSKAWMGYTNASELAVNDTLLDKMNPSEPMLGSEENYVPCTPDWNCSLYGNCQPSNESFCISVEDLNMCGESYGGNMSEFTEPCVYVCEPDWICTGYNGCTVTDERFCNETFDLENCSVSYGGNYSEFEPEQCDYCLPDWYCLLFGGCISKNQACLNVSDDNSCYVATNLTSDQFNGTLSAYNKPCGYVVNYTAENVPGVIVDLFGTIGASLKTNMSLIILSLALVVISTIITAGVINIKKVF